MSRSRDGTFFKAQRMKRISRELGHKIATSETTGYKYIKFVAEMARDYGLTRAKVKEYIETLIECEDFVLMSGYLYLWEDPNKPFMEDTGEDEKKAPK